MPRGKKTMPAPPSPAELAATDFRRLDPPKWVGVITLLLRPFQVRHESEAREALKAAGVPAARLDEAMTCLEAAGLALHAAKKSLECCYD